MQEPGLTKLLLGLAGCREEFAAPTPACLPVSRVRTGILRESWTEAEASHLAGCPHCQQAEKLAIAQVWHPPLADLFRQARGLADPSNPDTPHHLQKDACRRCLRLVSLFSIDRILARLAGQIRSGAAGAASRLSRVLASGAVASLALAAGPATGACAVFEGGGQTVRVVAERPARLRMDLAAGEKNAAPRLMRVLVGDAQTASDHLVVPRPASAALTADVAPPALPARTVSVAVYEVDASLLAQEDAALIRDGYTAACKLDPAARDSWQAWASHALQRPELDGLLRPTLSSVARLDPGKPAV